VAEALSRLARRRRRRLPALAGVTGSEREARQARAALGEIVRGARGVAVGTAIGRAWAKNRFRGPYLRNSLWDAGIAVETMETCVPGKARPGC
jgi:alkyldihydroxyacetonephosphate synthase